MTQQHTNGRILNDIGRISLLGNRKKIAKFLRRTFACRSTFLYATECPARKNLEHSFQFVHPICTGMLLAACDQQRLVAHQSKFKKLRDPLCWFVQEADMLQLTFFYPGQALMNLVRPIVLQRS